MPVSIDVERGRPPFPASPPPAFVSHIFAHS